MMEELQLKNPNEPNKGDRPSRVILFAGAVAVLFLVWFFLNEGGVLIYRGSDAGKRQVPHLRESHLPFGAAERAYAANVRIENLSLTRAENFLHQEVTSLSGEITNSGNRSLRAVELRIEFSDDLHQVVLRETRTLFGGPSAPLAAGGRREFEVSFEHIPSSWNRQQPTVSITGIQFAPGDA